MAKEFNTAVTCNPKRHYMVDTTNKMKVFESLIDNQKYFTISRARQFGKSTSLNWILWNMNNKNIDGYGQIFRLRKLGFQKRQE